MRKNRKGTVNESAESYNEGASADEGDRGGEPNRSPRKPGPKIRIELLERDLRTMLVELR
jgi:hypothetical protein